MKRSRLRKARKVGTIADVCRAMILDGATNDEVLEILKDRFTDNRFDGHKMYYPSWYRCKMRRDGDLPPAFDHVRKDPNVVYRFED